MASLVYNSALFNSFSDNLDWDGGTTKIALMTSAYVPNKDTDVGWDDISANEASGAGYSSGGATVVVTVTQDNANDEIVINFPAASWSGSTITARGAVYYRSSITPKQLLAYIDFGSDVSSTGGTFAVTSSKLTINNI